MKNGSNVFKRAIKHPLRRIIAPSNNPQDCSMLKLIDDGDLGEGFVDHVSGFRVEMRTGTSTTKAEDDSRESINILPIVEANDA